MKDFITVIAFFLGIVYVGEYLEKNNTDLYEVFDVEKPVSIETEVPSAKIPDEQTSQTTDDAENKPLIVIRALGDIDNGDLDYAAKVVKDFYGYKVKFDDKVNIDNSMYNESGELQSVNTCFALNSTEKTLYITDRKLYSVEGTLLRGTAHVNNKEIIVRGDRSFMKETIIHEIGHTLGLGHCDDLTCVMATHNDAYDSGDFCNKCKNKIGF